MKILGYILAGAGLAALAVSSPKMTSAIPIISSLPDKTLLVVGGVLVLAGVAILMTNKSSGSSKVKHAQPEVPIYEGTGKNRKIVGYQKA
jgi:uncharacterized protein YjeT (DUF2065 family)